MPNELTIASAPQGDARLRHQRARIAQRHLQFGRHCRLDIGYLLLRVAQRVRGPATLGDFVVKDRACALARQEWFATLADLTTVVVGDWRNAPSSVGIDKAVSVVQSRAYLEQRARRLLLPFGKERGSWRLVTIDFATEARRHACEFLMCFAFRSEHGAPSMASPWVEIGFAVPVPADAEPIFVLTIVKVVGFPT